MPQPCIQEHAIGTFEATLEAISHTLEELKESSKQTIELMRVIGAQGEALQSLARRQDTTERDVDALYNRVRGLELKEEARAATDEVQAKQDASDRALTNGIKIAVGAAAIIAIITFGLVMLDQHDYLRKPEAPKVQGGKR